MTTKKKRKYTKRAVAPIAAPEPIAEHKTNGAYAIRKYTIDQLWDELHRRILLNRKLWRNQG